MNAGGYTGTVIAGLTLASFIFKKITHKPPTNAQVINRDLPENNSMKLSLLTLLSKLNIHETSIQEIELALINLCEVYNNYNNRLINKALTEVRNNTNKLTGKDEDDYALEFFKDMQKNKLLHLQNLMLNSSNKLVASNMSFLLFS